MKTRDIYFAAYLKSEKIKLIGFEKVGRIVYFEFDIKPEDLQDIRINFLNSKYNEIKNEIENLKVLGD